MECNKVEARRAIDIAERKISENDYVGAKKIVNKAQKLYPELDGLKQLSMMINVYISASNKVNGGREADWYGILGVDPLADDETVKKQYKKLALLIHPDKNKFNGAGEAFKLVSEAWCLLSDKAERTAYDQKRISKQFKHKKSGMQHKRPRHEPYASSNTPKHEPEPGSSSKNAEAGRIWTKCNRCNTCSIFESDTSYLDKTLPCPNCGQDYVVTKIAPEIINGMPVYSPSKIATDTSSSASASTSDGVKAAYETMKTWFEPEP